MERDGLVVVSGDRHLELTGIGRTKAVHVMRKHRLAERLLSDVIGLDWEYVHEEACRWEHVMSEQVERRIIEMLDHPTESPYGNPIPGLDEFGDAAAVPFTRGVVNLLSLVARNDPELLLQLKQFGVVPGNKAAFSQVGSYILVEVEGFPEGLELPNEVAGHIFVGI